MAEYFTGGHLRFVNGEWRDDNGDVIEIARVRHGRWISLTECANEGVYCSICKKKYGNPTTLGVVKGAGIKFDLTIAPTAAQRWTEVTAIALYVVKQFK